MISFTLAIIFCSQAFDGVGTDALEVFDSEFISKASFPINLLPMKADQKIQQLAGEFQGECVEG